MKERGLTPVVECPAAVEERRPDDGWKDTDGEKENWVQGPEVSYNGNGFGGGGAIKTNRTVSPELMKDMLAEVVDDDEDDEDDRRKGRPNMVIDGEGNVQVCSCRHCSLARVR